MLNLLKILKLVSFRTNCMYLLTWLQSSSKVLSTPFNPKTRKVTILFRGGEGATASLTPVLSYGPASPFCRHFDSHCILINN